MNPPDFSLCRWWDHGRNLTTDYWHSVMDFFQHIPTFLADWDDWLDILWSIFAIFGSTFTVVCKIVHKIASVWCKTASGEVGVSLPWWCAALVLLAPGYWSLYLNFKNWFIGQSWKFEFHKVKLMKFQSFNFSIINQSFKFRKRLQ